MSTALPTVVPTPAAYQERDVVTALAVTSAVRRRYSVLALLPEAVGERAPEPLVSAGPGGAEVEGRRASGGHASQHRGRARREVFQTYSYWLRGLRRFVLSSFNTVQPLST